MHILKTKFYFFYEAVSYNSSDIEILEEEYFPNNKPLGM